MLRHLSFGLLLCASLSACGGGGSALPPRGSSSGPPPTQPTGAQSVTIAIGIPASQRGGSALQRRPLYISANTQSAAFVVNGGTPVIANLGPASPNCVPVAGGGRTCTVVVSAPVGTDTIAETLYATTNGTGPVLSQSTTSATIVAGQANTVSITLDGVVASLGLALSNATPPVGTPANLALTVNFNDASGAAIIGSDPFVNPITLSDSDKSGITTLSKTTLNSPADAAGLTVTYNGKPLSSAVFTATSAGVTAATLTLTPQNSPPVQFNDFTTFGFDNQRSGFNPNSTAITPASVGNLHLAWQVAMGGGDYNVQAQPLLATEIPNHAGVLFIGGGSGFVDAQDALTGQQVWPRVFTGQESYTCGNGQTFLVGVGGTPAYDPGSHSLYIAGNSNPSPNAFAQNSLVRIDAASGAKISSFNFGANQVGPSELNFSHTSVTLSNGIAYVGTGTTCDVPSWRGRVAAVNVSTMTSAGTYYTVWTPSQQWGGGGVWGWGGVALDFNGNVLAGVGNTDDGTNGPIAAPFVAAPHEYSGNGETLLELRSDLSAPIASNHPIPQNIYGGQVSDLDVNGTPVVFKPLGTGCPPMVALQSKEGALLMYDENNVGQGPVAQYQFAPSTFADGFLGVTAFSQANGLLYSVVASNTGPTFLAPGMVAINPGCGSPSIAWHATFGPDGTTQGVPRSVPAVSAGGVAFVATSCEGTSGLCPVVGTGGAIWELDASNGTILNGGSPILYTSAPVRSPATIDGNWVYIVDMQGDLYGLTIDPHFAKIAAKRRTVDSRLFNRMKARPIN